LGYSIYGCIYFLNSSNFWLDSCWISFLKLFSIIGFIYYLISLINFDLSHGNFKVDLSKPNFINNKTSLTLISRYFPIASFYIIRMMTIFRWRFMNSKFRINRLTFLILISLKSIITFPIIFSAWTWMLIINWIFMFVIPTFGISFSSNYIKLFSKNTLILIWLPNFIIWMFITWLGMTFANSFINCIEINSYYSTTFSLFTID